MWGEETTGKEAGARLIFRGNRTRWAKFARRLTNRCTGQDSPLRGSPAGELRVVRRRDLSELLDAQLEVTRQGRL